MTARFRNPALPSPSSLRYDTYPKRRGKTLHKLRKHAGGMFLGKEKPTAIRPALVKQLNPTYGFDHRSDFLRCVSVIERLPCAKGAVSEAD